MAWLVLVLGVLIWAYSHLMKRITPDFREKLGEGPGKGVATVLSFLSLGLMIWGYRQAPVIELWPTPAFLRHINNLLMLVAVVLVSMRSNRGQMQSWMRHPMLTSVIVWAVAHLLVNGDLASLILFGGIGLWAIWDILAINRMQPAWQRPAPGPVVNDAIHLGIAAVVFAGIVWLHGWLGYPPLG